MDDGKRKFNSRAEGLREAPTPQPKGNYTLAWAHMESEKVLNTRLGPPPRKAMKLDAPTPTGQFRIIENTLQGLMRDIQGLKEENAAQALELEAIHEEKEQLEDRVEQLEAERDEAKKKKTRKRGAGLSQNIRRNPLRRARKSRKEDW